MKALPSLQAAQTMFNCWDDGHTGLLLCRRPVTGQVIVCCAEHDEQTLNIMPNSRPLHCSTNHFEMQGRSLVALRAVEVILWVMMCAGCSHGQD